MLSTSTSTYVPSGLSTSTEIRYSSTTSTSTKYSGLNPGQWDLEIGPMALKNNRDLLLCPFQLWVSFHSHQCIWLGTYSAEMLKSGQNWHFVVPRDHEIGEISEMTLKNNRTPLLCPSNFMHHFIVISEFIFELQSGNAQIRSILAIFCLMWPWNFRDDLQKQ